MTEDIDWYANDFDPPNFDGHMMERLDQFFADLVRSKRCKVRGKPEQHKYTIREPIAFHVGTIKTYEEMGYVSRWTFRKMDIEDDTSDLVFEVSPQGLEAVERGLAIKQRNERDFDRITLTLPNY